MSGNPGEPSDRLDKATAFSRLRDLLVEKFDSPLKEDLQPLIKDAGIQPTRINFDGSIQNVWDRILTEAGKSGRLPTLVKLAAERYPDARPGLEKALADYQQASATSRFPRHASTGSPRTLVGVGLVLLVAIIGGIYFWAAHRCRGGFNARFLVMYEGKPTVATASFENPCTKTTDGFQCGPDAVTSFHMPCSGRFRILCIVGLTNQRPTNQESTALGPQNQPVFPCSKNFDVVDNGEPISLSYTQADKVRVQTLDERGVTR